MAEEGKQRPISGEEEEDDDDEEDEKESETETEGEELEGDEWEADSSADPSKAKGDLVEAGGRPSAAASSSILALDRNPANPNPNSIDDGDGEGNGNGKVEVVEPVSSLSLTVGERRAGATEESGSRRLFQRLWTDEEEIRILRGFLEFTRRRGTTFASHQYDTGPFYEEIRRELHLDFSKNQLIEKLRRLKKKYRNCAARMRSKGPAFSFRSPHEHQIFDIARHIWRPANKRLETEELSFSFSSFPPSSTTDHNHPDPDLDLDHAKPHNRSSGRRARRRLHHDAPPPPPPPSLQHPQPQPVVTAAVPVSVSPPTHHEAAAAAAAATVTALPAHPISSSSSVSVVEDTVRTCLSPLFKELISSAIGGSSPGLFSLGPMPACPPGKSGDDRWRKQQILELEVYLQRIELVKEQVMQALQDLKSSTS